MACFHPLDAWRTDAGEILFHDRGSGRHLVLPCGQCVGCRLERSRQWAIRCMHEAQMHSQNAFVTLTYNEENFSPSLRYSDFQLFMKRARKELGPLRFICAESMVSGLFALIFTLFFSVWILVSTVIFGVVAVPVLIYFGVKRLRDYGRMVCRR